MKRMNWGRVRRIAAWGAAGLAVALILFVCGIYAMFAMHPLDPKLAATPDWLEPPPGARATDAAAEPYGEFLTHSMRASGAPDFDSDSKKLEAQRKAFLRLKSQYEAQAILVSWIHLGVHLKQGGLSIMRREWFVEHRSFVELIRELVDAGGPPLPDLGQGPKPHLKLPVKDDTLLILCAQILNESAHVALQDGNADGAVLDFARSTALSHFRAGIPSWDALFPLFLAEMDLKASLEAGFGETEMTPEQARALQAALVDPSIARDALLSADRFDFTRYRKALISITWATPSTIVRSAIFLAWSDDDISVSSGDYAGEGLFSYLRRQSARTREAIQRVASRAVKAAHGVELLNENDAAMKKLLE